MSTHCLPPQAECAHPAEPYVTSPLGRQTTIREVDQQIQYTLMPGTQKYSTHCHEFFRILRSCTHGYVC